MKGTDFRIISREIDSEKALDNEPTWFLAPIDGNHLPYKIDN
jgi:hypothetical protein